MKTLVLVRHAKSSRKDETLDDIDRPLNKRGKRDAPIMATAFAERDIDIELVICSPAKRTRRTAKIFCGELGYRWHDAEINEQLYEARAGELQGVIRHIDDDVDAAMLFGHNPSFTDLANQFAPAPIDNLPTCGIVTMVFDTSRWKKVAGLQPVEFDFDYPKKRDRGQ